MLKIKNLNQLKSKLKNKKVLLRADLNLPVTSKNKKAEISDLTRLIKLKPTIDFLLQEEAKIVICSHFGRPKGTKDFKYSLQQIIPALETNLQSKIQFVSDFNQIDSALNSVKSPEIILLENLRFNPEEELNDTVFAKNLASHFDYFINDAFGAAHRAHASTDAICNFLPSYAGKLMETEYNTLSKLISQPSKPLTLIIGGAKIDTKIGILKHFIPKTDYILIGGALANTFLVAQGFEVGKSLVETNKIELAQEILLLAEQHNCKIFLPGDVIVADSIDVNATTIDIPLEDITPNMIILDIGRLTAREYGSIIHKSNTIILNGPMGLYENPNCAEGTKHVLEEISKSKKTTILGGGDTIDALNKFQINPNKFTHISTGGGAMIEFLEGTALPGITNLLEHS